MLQCSEPLLRGSIALVRHVSSPTTEYFDKNMIFLNPKTFIICLNQQTYKLRNANNRQKMPTCRLEPDKFILIMYPCKFPWFSKIKEKGFFCFFLFRRSLFYVIKNKLHICVVFDKKYEFIKSMENMCLSDY